jgi:hypothetical protein
MENEMNQIELRGHVKAQKRSFAIVWIARLLLVLALGVCMASMLVSAYFLGKLNGALDPLRSYEVPMCVAYDTHIRADPTGYILGDVPAGTMVWFTKLDLPFAHVAFYDGNSWLEGTVTATAIEACK